MPEATAQPSAPRRLADFLRERQDRILGDWESIVRQMHVAQDLTRPLLLDHMPEFLDDLIRYVGEVRAGHEVESPQEFPRIHALERLEVGYDLAEVVSEYAALRRCISGLIAREASPALRSIELPRLHEAIDQAIATSVVRYTETRERTLRSLDRISSAALVQSDAAALLPSTLNVLLETTPAVDAIAVLLLEQDRLHVRAAVGLARDQAQGTSLAVGECFAGRVAKELTPLFLRDASTDPMVTSAYLQAAGVRALYGVPIVLGERLVGVAMMGSRTTYEFSQEDQFLFRTMANRATGLLAQARLAEQEQKRAAELEAVIESIPDAVYVGDAGGIHRTNTAGLRMLGFDSVEELNRNIAALSQEVDLRDGKTSESAHDKAHPFVRALAGEASFDQVVVRNRKTGAQLVLRSAAAPVRVGGEVIGAVTVNTDITERVREEQELRAALQFRDRMLGVLSHDLRNPLSVIVTSAQVLAHNPALGAPQRRSVERIQRNAGRMELLIHDLLDYTRAGQGRGIPVAPQPCDLLQLCNQVVDNARVLQPERKLEIAAQGDTGGCWDPQRALQIISNLVGNALRHSPVEAPIRVALDGRGPDVLLEVQNGGLPIAPELIPTLFDAFQRGVPDESGAAAGLGLGLYIVRQLVRAHGGEVSVRSDAASGTTFTVRWPRGGPAQQEA